MAIHQGNLATTQDFKGFLEPKLAEPIFKEVARRSYIQQLGQKVQMGPTGVTVPQWEGNVTASWVKETGKKPLTKGGFSKFSMTPEKIATIFVMSAEVVRANPLGYSEEMKVRVAEAFAKAFDDAAFYGTNSPFGSYINETTKVTSLVNAQQKADAYAGFNNGLSLLVKDGKKWTGGVLDLISEPIINSSVDANGRPLFTEPTYTQTNSLTIAGRVLSRPTLIAEKVKNGDVLGFMGDFSKVLWGQIGGISYDISDQATLDLSEQQDGSGMTSLWQHNLVAVRCEAEFALRVHDKDAFVKIKETA